MTPIQHSLPDGSYINETLLIQHAVPSGSYVNEDVSASPPPAVAATFARRKHSVAPTTVPNWFYLRRKRGTIALPPPPPPPPGPIPYSNRNRYYFTKPLVPAQLRPPKAKRAGLGSVPVLVPSMFIDGFVREILVANVGSDLKVTGLVREVLVNNTTPLVVDGLVREILGAFVPPQSAIPVFPTLPYMFPLKLTPTMNTIIGESTSAREVRIAMQGLPLWEIELPFDELRDQDQNIVDFAYMAGYTQYMQLVQLWLSMYGQAGVFAFDAPWDNSRENQAIGTGDGTNYVFTIYRTWGQAPQDAVEPIGQINEVFNVSVDGVPVDPSQYFVLRNKIYFIANGFVFPPAANAVITMTFSFYYVCRFVENNQDFEQFSQGRWTVPSLKFQSVYWP